MLQRGNLRIDLLRHCAEVGVLYRSEDIDDRLRIVVGDDRRSEAAGDGRKAAQQLRLSRGGDRHVLQVIERGHQVLRRLSDERVLQAGVRIEPERGRDLSASGQRQQQVVGDVLLADTQLLRTGPIGAHSQLRLIEHLLHAQIDEARDVAQRRQQPVGDLAILRARPDDLDVDGRRHAEVEDLADDVRGKEGERRPWELPGQPSAQRADIVGRRRMIGLQ